MSYPPGVTGAEDYLTGVVRGPREARVTMSVLVQLEGVFNCVEDAEDEAERQARQMMQEYLDFGKAKGVEFDVEVL